MKKLAIALLALCAPIDALTGIESVEIDTWAFSISYKKHAKKAARAVKSAYEDAVVAVADFWKKARVVSGGVYVDGKAAGVIRVKVGRANGKGVVSVSGAITGFDGRKLSASGGRVVVDGESLTVALKVKDGSTATVTVGKDGIAGS